jgi:hypothetical protein
MHFRFLHIADDAHFHAVVSKSETFGAQSPVTGRAINSDCLAMELAVELAIGPFYNQPKIATHIFPCERLQDNPIAD